MSVTIPVRGQNRHSGPREVRNQFFDDESDEEPEGVPEVLEDKAELSEADQIEESMRTMGKIFIIMLCKVFIPMYPAWKE